MPPFEGLLSTLLTDPNPNVRRRAAVQLGETPTTQGIAGLRSALGDEHSDVRRAATVSLLRAGDPKTVARVLKAVGSDDIDIAIEAAHLIGRARYSPGVPRLLEVFRSAKSPVAAAVADALGEIGDRIATPLLCLAVDNKFVTVNACNALGRIGDSRALTSIMRMFEQGQTSDVRAASARALGLIRKRGQRGVATKDMAVWSRVMPVLRLAIDDKDRAVRVNVAVALWDLGDRSLPVQTIREIEEMTTALNPRAQLSQMRLEEVTEVA